MSDFNNKIKIDEQQLYTYKGTLVKAQNFNKTKTIVYNNNINYYSVQIIRIHF